MKMNGSIPNKPHEPLNRKKDEFCKQKHNQQGTPPRKNDTFSLRSEEKHFKKEEIKGHYKPPQKQGGHGGGQHGGHLGHHENQKGSASLIAGAPNHTLYLKNPPHIPATTPSFPDQEPSHQNPPSIYLDQKEIDKMWEKGIKDYPPLIGSDEYYSHLESHPPKEEGQPSIDVTVEVKNQVENATKSNKSLIKTLDFCLKEGADSLRFFILQEKGEDALKKELGPELFEKYYPKTDISGGNATSMKESVKEMLRFSRHNQTLLDSMFSHR